MGGVKVYGGVDNLLVEGVGTKHVEGVGVIGMLIYWGCND